MTIRTLLSVLLILVVGLLSGCAAHQMEVSKGSGFLGDYSQLQPGGTDRAALLYMKPGVNYKQYNKVMIAPVVIYLKTDADHKAIDPEEMKELTDYFHQSMVNAFKDGYTVVNKPGPGVLIIRTAVTDVIPGKPVRGTLSSILPPGIIVSSGAKAATGEYPSVGQAEVEMEVLDAQTGERLAAAVDRRAGTKGPFRGSQEDAKEAFDYWAQRMRMRLDEARGVK